VFSTYLRLARLPNVFTALADVLAGLAIAQHGHFELRDLALVAASGFLYPAGMVLNDFFDRHVDARERPERPIPSGQVRAHHAAWVGFGLMAAGIAVAGLRGRASLVTAAALAAAILLYDAVLKSTRLGPPAMGLCRLLNVALGLSAAEAGDVIHDLHVSALLLPVALGVYTGLLTVLARDEVHGGARWRVRAIVTAMALLGAAYVVILAAASPAGFTSVAMVLYAFLLLRGSAVFGPVWSAADALPIRRAIGGGILLMPAIDAAAVAAAGHPFSAAIVVLLALPAQILKRRIAMS
jgi:hypothetical protein